MSEELKPCPWCGGQAALTNVRMSDHTFRVGCYNDSCGVRPATDYYGSREQPSSANEVIAAWNSRSTDTSEVSRLREALEGGVAIIAAERQRHFDVEDWTPDHDDHHTDQSLALAAACYAWPPMRPIEVKKAWPWESCEWKPELFGVGADVDEKIAARIRVLAKAGALVAAEIDRLERSRAALQRKG